MYKFTIYSLSNKDKQQKETKLYKYDRYRLFKKQRDKYRLYMGGVLHARMTRDTFVGGPKLLFVE